MPRTTEPIIPPTKLTPEELAKLIVTPRKPAGKKK